MKKAGEVVRGSIMRFLQTKRMTLKNLDGIAKELVEKSNVESSFLGYAPPGMAPYPAYICASPNDAIVHGIPDDTGDK